MAEKDKKTLAKETLYSVLKEIANEKGLAVGMDYAVPVSFQINPHDLTPYAVDTQKKDTYLTDFCIGKGVGKEIMPGICIDVFDDVSPSSRAMYNKAYAFKTLHRQARYGVLLFEADHIQTGVLNDEQLCYIDFIEALGQVFPHKEKIKSILEDIIHTQMRSSDDIAGALFGDNKIRSISKRYS